MGLFSKFKNVKKDENSVAFRRQMAQYLSGRQIKYAVERVDGEDLVVGKSGSITVRDGQIIVFAAPNIVYRGLVDQTKSSELMNLSGAVLIGPDLEHGGAERMIVAYYIHY